MLKYIIEKNVYIINIVVLIKKTKEKNDFTNYLMKKQEVQMVTKVIEEYELEGKLIYIKSVNSGNINKTYVAYFEKKKMKQT
mgnify:CR=1 FL=1